MDTAPRLRPAPLVVLLFGAAIGLLAGMVWAVVTPVTHSAASTLFVSAQGAGAVTDLRRGAELSEEAADSFEGVATGRAVLEPVSREFGLTVAQLAERVSVERPTDTALLRIRATDPSAARAAAISNAVALRLSASSERLQPAAPGSTSVHLTTVERAAASRASTGGGMLTRVVSGLLLGIGAGAAILLAIRLGERRPPGGRGVVAPAPL